MQNEKYKWLNSASKQFLANGYLEQDEDAIERFSNIAMSAEKSLGIKGFAEKFENYLSLGYYSLSSPIVSNFGKKRGLPISCFSVLVPDNTAGILNKASEVGIMSKSGGGTAGFFGKVRSRGSVISTGGATDGPVRFMQIFETVTDVISQGGVRRGSFAAYLPVEHPDILEFLQIRGEGHPIQNISLGVTITDNWMEEMIGGDKPKRKIWGKILEKRSETGYPYIFFTDTANNNAPQVYKDKGKTIHSSQLCVTGDQRVVSQHGMLTAKELCEIGGELQLFDNKNIVGAEPMTLVERNADVYKVCLSNGMEHKVTGYHKLVKFVNKKQNVGEAQVITTENTEVKNLKVGDFVAVQTAKGIFGKKKMPAEAFLLGKRLRNETKEHVPSWIWQSDEETVWQYIRGLFYVKNSVLIGKSNGKAIQPYISSTNVEWLKEIQLLLSNLGVKTSIKILRTLLPNSKSDRSERKTKDCWRLIIGNELDAKKFHKITSISYEGKEDVYCTTVDSKEHLWVCNGFVTHNCAEIFLSTDEDESFVCNLSSMNLLSYEEWKDTDAVETLIYFLDAVMSEFIEKTTGVQHMECSRKFAVSQRALGLGVLGWHSYLQSKSIPFESMEAKIKNVEIFKLLRDKCLQASKDLAVMFGEPELLKGYGLRNVTQMAIAPTTSSSFIFGGVSQGIEPMNSNYFVKKLAKGNFTYKNPFLKEVLKKYNKNDEGTWKSILVKGGSVQHLEFLLEIEKNTFKTFGEISQKEIVIQAAQRQKYIDQGQSLNLMIPSDAEPRDINALLIEGWRLGIKTFYYQRGANPAQELARKLNHCVSCEA